MKKILSAIFTLLVLFACSKNNQNNDEWVAKIEGQIITLEEFNKAFDILLKLNFTQGQGALMKEDPVFRRQALDSLISQKLILSEVDKTDLIKPEFMQVFELQGLTQYFIHSKILPKIEIPSEDWIKAKYNDTKIQKALKKRGISNYEQAKQVIVSEYQKARYVQNLQEAMKNLKYKLKISLNDEFEENAIEKYLKNQLEEKDYDKTWLFKIEGKTYTAKDMENFIRSMVEISYGERGIFEYTKNAQTRQNFRSQLLNDYIGALMVMTEAQKENWLDKDEVKDFVSIYIKNAKTKFYLERKIASKVEAPSNQELAAYYQAHKDQIQKPFAQVKEALAYRILSEKVQAKTARYIEKIIEEKGIPINEKLFEAPKKGGAQKEESK